MMISLHFDEALKQATDFQADLAQAASYTAQLQAVAHAGDYQAPESSLVLPADQSLLESVTQLTTELRADGLLYHVVIGIGGSNLGTKAVYDALWGYADVMQPDRAPKLLFAETTSPEWLRAFTQLAASLEAPEQILVSVISKSGGTTETLANFEIIMQALTDRLGGIEAVAPRLVAITDEGSALWHQAERLGARRLALPKLVGGRYSVLSAVGLLPLASVGADITRLRQGALELRDTCLADESANIAAASAAVLAYYHRRGAVINDNFFFSPQLESLGKWYRQLMGESIGKQEALTGETVYAGITPTVSLGSTDLHSVGQLYLGGPKDKLTTFVYSRDNDTIAVPAASQRLLPELVPMIHDQPAASIMQAIYQGTKIAYDNAERANMTVALDRIDAYHLGAYMQFKMLEMMYLGQLLNVNSFDQPNVELYKRETKQILERAGS